jgi:hypothetical protein
MVLVKRRFGGADDELISSLAILEKNHYSGFSMMKERLV